MFDTIEASFSPTPLTENGGKVGGKRQPPPRFSCSLVTATDVTVREVILPP